MRHGGRVLDQRFHAAQRLGQREDAHRAQQPEGLRPAAAHAEAEGAAAARHLPLRQRVLRVRGQSRMVHPRDRRVPLQPARDFERVEVVRLHAQRQRLDAAQHQEAIERRLARP